MSPKSTFSVKNLPVDMSAFPSHWSTGPDVCHVWAKGQMEVLIPEYKYLKIINQTTNC
jgi:hypothetical protein